MTGGRIHVKDVRPVGGGHDDSLPDIGRHRRLGRVEGVLRIPEARQRIASEPGSATWVDNPELRGFVVRVTSVLADDVYVPVAHEDRRCGRVERWCHRTLPEESSGVEVEAAPAGGALARRALRDHDSVAENLIRVEAHSLRRDASTGGVDHVGGPAGLPGEDDPTVRVGQDLTRVEGDHGVAPLAEIEPPPTPSRTCVHAGQVALDLGAFEALLDDHDHIRLGRR
jgi:hypothetical protein